MASRLILQEKLEEVLGNDRVYFQPPASISLKYPCIVYEIADIETLHANNNPYHFERTYKVTLMHKDPDNTVVDGILSMPRCRFDTRYTVDNLYHYVFLINF